MSSHMEGDCEIKSNVGVVLPTYCEAQNVGKLIRQIEALPLDSSILVIDDSSPDGTGDVVRTLQKEYSNLLLLTRHQKTGLGSAITDGFRTFLTMNHVPEAIVTMDADYSHNPQDIPRLLSSMNGGYDLAIGSRYVQNGKTEGWPFTRKVISRGANAIARWLLGLKLGDCTSGYRCYSTKFLREAIGHLHSQTYDIQIETLNQAHLQGFRIKEVPILFVNRKKGKSKLRLREIENYVSYIFKTVVLRR